MGRRLPHGPRRACWPRSGWPKGPVNAVELWNEPWEGITISGWGADMLRYREIYTAMAQGVEEARANHGVQVLIGGGCSSMNTEDKLFADGKDTLPEMARFHQHPLPAAQRPARPGPRVGRTAGAPTARCRCGTPRPGSPTREGRVAPVIASMRAQGQSRTAGVLHDVCNDLQNVDMRLEGGKTKRIDVVQVWAPPAGIASSNASSANGSSANCFSRTACPGSSSSTACPPPESPIRTTARSW